MEPQSTNLNPEAIRKIGLRLYGAEKFQADPATVILDTIAWVDAVLGDSEAQPFSHRQDVEIQQLVEVVRIKGVPADAAELNEMSVRAIILSAALALASVSVSLAGDRWPHYRFVPNDRGGFNFYDKQGYRGWMDQNGYFDNQGGGYRHWEAPDGEIPEIPEY